MKIRQGAMAVSASLVLAYSLLMGGVAAASGDDPLPQPRTVNERTFIAPPKPVGIHKPDGNAATIGRLMGGNLLNRAAAPVDPGATHP